MGPGAIPLAVLRANLDRGWPRGLHWKSGGGPRRARLELPLGTPVSFDLGPAPGELRLEGRVAIAPGAFGRTRIRVRADAIDAEGRGRKLWSATLRRRGARLRPAESRIEARFAAPRGTRLVLSASGRTPDLIVWEELAIRLADNPGGEPAPSPSRSEAAAASPPSAGNGPRFSVLTPVHDPPPALLEQTIASVLGQSFPDWELCLYDDGSTDPSVIDALRNASASDPRVRLERGERPGGISAATNAALRMASGEYIALLDHDDLLVPDALEQVDAALRGRPDTDMVYSDEEVFEEGDEASHRFAKPNWSPDLLRSQMYTCHLGIYRRSLAEEVGGFRSELDGSQDFDFVLRLSERTGKVLHIPRVLYRWRAHAGSTAGNSGAKPAAYPAGRLAIAHHLERTGVEADALFGPWDGIYRVVHRPRVGLEVAVGLTGEDEKAASALVGSLEAEAAHDGDSLRVERRGSIAEAAEACAEADVIVLCDGDLEPLTRHWLRRLVGFAVQPGVVAVGATTLAPDGRVEQNGIAIDEGLPVPMMFATGVGDPGPLGVGVLPANAAAVSGTVAFGGESFRELGGLDPELGGLAVPDLCLRGVVAGMRVVTAPDVLLRRRDGHVFVNDLGALAEFRHRWSGSFPRDPYFDLDSCWPGVEVT